MADEGLHEIQLNGKQLVFLFMASTVVAVVIFLCGVMVGRGVRAQRPADASEASVDAVTDPTADVVRPAEPVSPSAIPSSAPVASQETLTYPERLEGVGLPEGGLRPGGGSPPEAVTTAAPAKTIAKSIPRAPAGNGFVVQVAAVNDRREADAIPKRLPDKGKPTLMSTPPHGHSNSFPVRHGKHPSPPDTET